MEADTAWLSAVALPTTPLNRPSALCGPGHLVSLSVHDVRGPLTGDQGSGSADLMGLW